MKLTKQLIAFLLMFLVLNNYVISFSRKKVKFMKRLTKNVKTNVPEKAKFRDDDIVEDRKKFNWKEFFKGIIISSGIPIISDVVSAADVIEDKGAVVTINKIAYDCNYEGYKKLLKKKTSKNANKNAADAEEDGKKVDPLSEEQCSKMKVYYEDKNTKKNYKQYSKILKDLEKMGEEKIWKSKNYLNYKRGFNPTFDDFLATRGTDEFKKFTLKIDKEFFSNLVESYEKYYEEIKPQCEGEKKPADLSTIKRYFNGGWSLMKMLVKCKKEEVKEQVEEISSSVKNNKLLTGLVIGLSAIGVSLFWVFKNLILSTPMKYVYILLSVIKAVYNFIKFLMTSDDGKKKARFLGNTIGNAIRIPLLFFYVIRNDDDLDISIKNFVNGTKNALSSAFKTKALEKR